jgi:hypothetical protein
MAKKKRYHNSSASVDHHRDKFNDEMKHEKDREGRGFMHNYHGLEKYAGMEPRRRQEMEDYGMISEDDRAIANLPQNVMIKPYPRTGPYNPEMLNDSPDGVDAQMDYDDSQRARHLYPKKV